MHLNTHMSDSQRVNLPLPPPAVTNINISVSGHVVSNLNMRIIVITYSSLFQKLLTYTWHCEVDKTHVFIRKEGCDVEIVMIATEYCCSV